MQKGDFLLVEFWLRDQAGRLIQTTDEEQARKEGLHREGVKYGQRLVIVGEGATLPGLEEAVANAITGDSREITIPPEKAFGARREELTRLLPLSEFRARGSDPKQGDVVKVNDVIGRVQTVSGGRVRVDFNPEHAGQTIKAWFRVVKKIEDVKEKIEALAAEETPLNATVSYNEGVASVKIPAEAKKDASFFIAKTRFAKRAYVNLPELKKIMFEEEWAKETA